MTTSLANLHPVDPSTHPAHVTIYAGRKANVPNTTPRGTWQSLVDALANTQFVQCACSIAGFPAKDCAHKDGRAYSPGILRPGTTRGNENVDYLNVAFLDLDKLTPEAYAAALEKLAASGLEYVVSGTHSFRPEKPSVRVVIPLSRAVSGAEWARFFPALKNHLGLPVDEATKDQARIYYAPRTPEGVEYEHRRGIGFALDVDAIMTNAPVAPTNTSRALVANDDREVTHDFGPASEELLTKVRDMLVAKGPAIEGQNGEKHTYEVAAFLTVDCALNEDEAMDLMVEWNETCQPPWDDVDLERLLRNGEKYAQNGKQGRRGEYRGLLEFGVGLDSVGILDGKPKPVTMQTLSGPVTITPSAPPGYIDASASYSEAQWNTWALENGFRDGRELARNAILQHGSSFYPFVNGSYSDRPYPAVEFLPMLRVMEPAHGVGVRLSSMNSKGEERPMTPESIKRTYVQSIREVVVTYSNGGSRLNRKTETLELAAAPMRLEPEFDPIIAQYLSFWPVWAQRWFANVADQTKQLCLLYVTGKKSAGKSLVAQATAQLWDGAHSSLADVCGKFNENLLNSPLVWCDEGLPPELGGKEAATTFLRAMVGTSERNVSRKGIPSVRLKGNVRLLITANNAEMLTSTKEDLSQDDVDAVAIRIGNVFLDQPAADFLNSLKAHGMNLYTYFVKEQRFAKHILWMGTQEQWQAKPEERFVGATYDTVSREKMLLSSPKLGALVQFTVRHVNGHTQNTLNGNVQSKNAPGFIVGDGFCLVRTDAFNDADAWKMYAPTAKPPSGDTAVGKSLKSIAHPDVLPTVVRPYGVRYHALKVHLIAQWMDMAGSGDVEDFMSKVMAPHPVTARILENRPALAEVRHVPDTNTEN